MATRTPRVTLGSEWLRRRLLWTTVLVLVALGGAGLASAVDRPHTQAARPELGYVTDERAAPWLAEMLAQLEELEDEVVELAAAARRVFVGVSALRPAEVAAGVVSGDEISEGLGNVLGPLAATRAMPPAGVETWRLGEAQRQRLARIDTAIAEASDLPGVWRAMAEQTGPAMELITALRDHDEAAAAALAAGRGGEWERAVGQLEQAQPHLDAAAAARDELLSIRTAPMLDELIAGHRAHDEALLALYRHLADTGSLDDPEAAELRRQVEQARMPLPTPTATLQAVVAEAAGQSLSQRLAAIEEARGSITAALDAAEEQPPDATEASP